MKPRAKKSHSKPSATVAQQPRPVVGVVASVAPAQQQAPGEVVVGVRSGDASTVTELARALPHFSQVWTGQQQYIDQQVLAQLGQALFTNCDGGTINLVGVQPQALNVGDDRQMAVIYGYAGSLSFT